MPVGQREPAGRRRSIAWQALFDLSTRCRCSEVDDPYLEYAPKQFYIKMVFINFSRGQRPSLNLSVLPLGNSDTLTVGEPVVVVGSPVGLETTVTAGILSAIRDGGEGYTVLQTDAAVNHGNSGGPLVNASGLAVGVVSSILRADAAQGLNFAIPINYLRGLTDNLHDPMTLEQMREQPCRYDICESKRRPFTERNALTG
jgi:hypothetical protein